MNYLLVQNRGVCPTEAFTLIGASMSRGEDGLIGQFGSGAKLSICTLLRKGLKVIAEKVLTSKQLPEKAKLVYIAEEVERFYAYNKKLPIKVDDTGVGGGVTDILQRAGYNIVPVNFGAEANEPDKYPNRISEMWFEVGKFVHEIAWAASGRLQAELVNRKQKQLDKKGRRVVESKDDYKARGFRSPDEADAFLLTFCAPKPARQVKAWRLE